MAEDITEIVKAKMHKSYKRKNILERLAEIKRQNRKAYDLFCERNSGDDCSLKDDFYIHHYLAFDEVLQAVEWLVLHERCPE